LPVTVAAPVAASEHKPIARRKAKARSLRRESGLGGQWLKHAHNLPRAPGRCRADEAGNQRPGDEASQDKAAEG